MRRQCLASDRSPDRRAHLSRSARGGFHRALLATFAALVGCVDPRPVSPPSTEPTEARRTLQVPPEVAAKLPPGSTVQHYGGFSVVEVSPAIADSLLRALGVEARDHFGRILLNAGHLETATPELRAARGKTLPGEGPKLHLVQFAGPIHPKWHDELLATGARIVTYIPSNAYLIYGDAPALASAVRYAKAAPHVRWDGPYLHRYRIDPGVAFTAATHYTIQLVADPKTNADTLDVIRRLERKRASTRQALGYLNVVSELDRAALPEIALRPDVVSIQAAPIPTQRDERQDMIVSGNLIGASPSGPGYLAWLASKGFFQSQFNDSAFSVNVTDSGLDNGTTTPNHFGLYIGGNVFAPSRVVYARREPPSTSGTIQGCDGHGNLNAHIVAGYADDTVAPFADSSGYLFGLGVAPFVTVGSSVIFAPSFTFPSYLDLLARAYRDGSRISSNSWGAISNAYSADAQQYDALVRDAQPGGSSVPVFGNQEMVVVFAAGNSGSSLRTVGSPGTAKNVITVGASENVNPFGAADRCALGDTDADGAFDIARYSSRGPTADGRAKPDLVAPGTHITGGVAQSDAQRDRPPASPLGQANGCYGGSSVCGGTSSSIYYPAGQQWYTASSGTSHATPAVAGAAALLRQYFINQHLPPPSPAMTKAYLMGAARYLTGAGANDSLWSSNQGMGLLDLGMAFDGVPRQLDDQDVAKLFTLTGEARTFTGAVADPSKPFRVTLAWTDAPGSTAGAAWKNDLDLTVTIGGKTYKGNNFAGPTSVPGGNADPSNNVESVFLPAGTSGAYTVTVTAANINSDGVPLSGTATDQDFALVVYNACTTVPSAVTGLRAVANGANRIDLSWAPNNATSYTIYRYSDLNGMLTAVGVSSGPSFSDTTVSGGIRYYYIVRGRICSEGQPSEAASAIATGACTLAPSFMGLLIAGNARLDTCALELRWVPAVARCGGNVTYAVYRSMSAGFTPSASNRIASGLTSTSYHDAANIASARRYYYIVRATETTGTGAVEDANTLTQSASASGSGTYGLIYDDFDSNRPVNASAYWVPTGNTSIINLTSNCHFQSSNTSYRIGGAASAQCGGNYAVSNDATLVFGGDGKVSADVNGIIVPPASESPTWSFKVWYQTEASFDGVYLVYSKTSALGPWSVIGDSPSTVNPFITTTSYDATISSADGAVRAWSSPTAGNSANGNLKAVFVNLSPIGGQKVWFGFRFHSDSSVNYEGFYVDDVLTPAVVGAACTTASVAAGPAVSLRMTDLSPSITAGTPGRLTLTAYDAFDQIASGYGGPIDLATSDPTATFQGPIPFVDGVASNVSYTFFRAGSQSVTATDRASSLLTATGRTTVLPSSAASLSFTVQPSTATVATALRPAVKVSIADAYGNQVFSPDTVVSVRLGQNPGGAALSGTTTVGTAAGTAVFSNLSLDKVGSGYTLIASNASFAPATSAPFDVVASAPARLSFGAQPSNAVAGASLRPTVTVVVLDGLGNPTNASVPVTLSLAPSAGPAGALLSGGTSVTATSIGGVATFTDLWIDKAGSGYQLAAAAPALTGVTSQGFDIAAAPPTRVSFTTQPSDVVGQVAIAPAVAVTLLDPYGNLARSGTGTVSLSLGSNPGGALLAGTTSATAVAGVATFPDLTLDKAGIGYTLVAVSSGLRSDTSAGFNVTVGSAAKLAFVVQPTSADALAPIFPTVRVAVQDAQGNTVATANGAITVALAANPGGATLAGATSAPLVGGVATLNDLALDKVGSGYTLSASLPGVESIVSAPFDIRPGPPASLVFTTQPSSAVAGTVLSSAVTVAVLDAARNPARTAVAVTLALAQNPGGARLGGARSVTVNSVGGTAAFTGLSLDKAARGYTLSAVALGLGATTSDAFDISPAAPAAVAFVVEPADTLAHRPIAPPVQVEIQDAFGNVATQSSAVVSISLGNAPTGAALLGRTSAAAIGGIATFADLAVDTPANAYTLVAVSARLRSDVSAGFDVGVGEPAALAFVAQPTDAAVLSPIAPAVKVAALDADGNVVAAATGTVTVSLGQNPSGARLSGAVTAALVRGVASFADLSLDQLGAGYTLRATADGLADAESRVFAVRAGAPRKLTFLTQPQSASAGAPLTPTVTVGLLDAANNPVSAPVSVTVTLTEPRGASLSGGSAVMAPTVGSMASFPSLSVDRAATGYTLTASALGLESAVSAPFDIAPGAPAAVSFIGQPSDVFANHAIAPPVRVAIADRFGNLATQSSATVSLALASNPGGASLSGTLAAAATGGVATFADLTLDRPGVAYALVAVSPGLRTELSGGFNVRVAPKVGVAFVVQPSSVRSQQPIAPAIRVAIVDADGIVVPTATDIVTLSLAENPGAGTLSGSLSSAAVNGVATFSTVSIDKAASGYVLAAETQGLASDESEPFEVTFGDPARLAFAPPPHDAVAGEPFADVAVELLDAAGNRVASPAPTVTLALADGAATASLRGARTSTPVAGLATFPGLSIERAGTYTIAATAAGFSGATSAPFAITGARAATITVTLPESVAPGQPATLRAAATDRFGNAASTDNAPARLASSDSGATLPSTPAFVAGALEATVVFATIGPQTVTVTDANDGTLTGSARTVVTAKPTVAIVTPTEGNLVAGVVTVRAAATPSAGARITALTILVDGSPVGTAADATLSASWDVGDRVGGSTATLTATATDSFGNVATSDAIHVTIAKPGGCGCQSAGAPESDAGVFIGGALLGWLLLRRRRRGARALER